MTEDLAIGVRTGISIAMSPIEQENADWIGSLHEGHPRQAEAIEALRPLLLRGALYTFSRSLSDLYHLDRSSVLALAEDCAQEALIAILQQLDTFRGESRFTTWVYKFAVNKALETARRERWKGRSIDPLADGSASDREEPATAETAVTGPHGDPGAAAAQAEIWRIIQQVICEDLTERQRQVVRLMVFEEIPMDVVTERLNTNRNAVYKMLHDARRRIRARLQEHGFSTGEVLALFSAPTARDHLPGQGGECP